MVRRLLLRIRTETIVQQSSQLTNLTWIFSSRGFGALGPLAMLKSSSRAFKPSFSYSCWRTSLSKRLPTHPFQFLCLCVRVPVSHSLLFLFIVVCVFLYYCIIVVLSSTFFFCPNVRSLRFLCHTCLHYRGTLRTHIACNTLPARSESSCKNKND